MPNLIEWLSGVEIVRVLHGARDLDSALLDV